MQPAKILLSEWQSLQQTDQWQGRQLFSEQGSGFSRLQECSDEILQPAAMRSYTSNTAGWLLLIPIYGAIECRDNAGNENKMAAGQLLCMPVQPGIDFIIQNPFGDMPVNYLRILISDLVPLPPPLAAVITYDVNRFPSVLLQVSPGVLHDQRLPFKLSIGLFGGRNETSLQPAESRNGFFFYVLEGAFEIAGRLLHARDALAIARPDAAAAEALSNDALLIAVELPFFTSGV